MPTDRTKMGQRLDARYDENQAHLPDADYFNEQMENLGAIQSNEAQKAGPRATFKTYIPDGKNKQNMPSMGEAPNRSDRWK